MYYVTSNAAILYITQQTTTNQESSNYCIPTQQTTINQNLKIST